MINELEKRKSIEGDGILKIQKLICTQSEQNEYLHNSILDLELVFFLNPFQITSSKSWQVDEEQTIIGQRKNYLTHFKHVYKV